MQPLADALAASAERVSQVILLISHVVPHVSVGERWVRGGA
jgi:hypothetical protein